MTKEELASVADFEALRRSSQSMWQVSGEIWRSVTYDALFNTRGTLPCVQVVVLWCDSSMNECVWAAKSIEVMAQDIRESKNLSEVTCIRNIDIVRIENGNHFVSLGFSECY
jgi:hypothetical protein